MAINWEMGVTDPLRGVNQGLASLGQALQYQQKQEQMKPAIELQNLQLQQAKQAATDQGDLRNTLANLKDVVSEGYTDAATGQEVPQTTTPSSPIKAAYDFWSKRDPVKAESIANGVLASAQHMAQTTNDHAGAVDMVNRALGTQLKYVGSKNDRMTLKNADGSEFIYDLVSGKTIVSGQPKPEKKTYAPMTTRDMPIAGGMMQRMQFNPETGKDEPYGVPFKPTAQQRLEIGEKPKPAKPLPAGQLESLSDASQLIKTLKEAQKISPKVNTGMVAGRLQSIGQKFGKADENFNQLKQKLSTVENIMLKLRSGAAVTESEYNRFMNEMPTVNDDEAVRDTKMNNAIKYAEELLSGKIATYEEGGYKVPTGLTARSQPAKQPTTKAYKTASDYLNKWK